MNTLLRNASGRVVELVNTPAVFTANDHAKGVIILQPCESDRKLLEQVIPENGGVLLGQWFEFDFVLKRDDGAIILHAQTPNCQNKIARITPHDQAKYFAGKWKEGVLSLTECDAPSASKPQAQDDNAVAQAEDIATLKGKKKGQLERIAAERGVEWDEAASIDTMIEKIAKAKK